MADASSINAPAGREGPLTPHVFIRGGEVFTSSRDVAALFEKEHRHVLRAIDDLIEQEPSLASGHLPNFGQVFADSEGHNGAVRQFRTFDMDRDGFSLLAMGFTGPKALKWKLRYIEAFNMMEEALKKPAPLVASLSERLKIVREARINYGRDAARKMWAELGLPPVAVEPEAQAFTASPFADPQDWRGALRHLCFAPATHAATTLWAVARHAAGGEGGAPSTAAALWLIDRGMVHDGRPDGWLFISNLSVWADRHFAGTPWAGCWRAALKGAAGAQRARFYLGRRQQRGVRIPLRVIASLAAEG